MDVLKDRSIARYKYLNHLLDKGESIDDIKYYDFIDFDIDAESIPESDLNDYIDLRLAQIIVNSISHPSSI